MKNIQNIEKILLTRWIVIILAFFSVVNISFADNNASFIKNIKLPNTNDGGTLVPDLIYADGHIFAYANNKILVYNAGNNSLEDTIRVSHYGKFDPIYFFYGFWVGDYQLMAFNQTNHLLYVVTPDLKIISIQTNSTSFTKNILLDTPSEVSSFETLNGRCSLKYDNTHQRLYWILGGRDNVNNGIGGFHVRNVYFALYNINNNGYNALRIYHEYIISHTDYLNTPSSVVFFESDNYFYVSKKKKIVRYFINSNNTVERVDSLVTTNGKFSKLITLETQGVSNTVKKVIAFPYRMPDPTVYEPPIGYDVSMYVLDGNLPFHYDSIIAPSKRIIDGVIRNNNNLISLLVCYAPDQYVQNSYQNSDVAVYDFNTNTALFQFRETINTNSQHSEDTEYPLTLNYPLHLFKNSDNNIYLGKINNIIKISTNNSFSELYRSVGSFFFRATRSNDFIYYTNLTKNGIDIFDNNLQHTEQKTGFSAYHITANTTDHKLYFYNKLNRDASGIYVYNTDNEAVEQFINIPSTIGDVVYNPYNDDFLVSLNKSGNLSQIKVFNGSDNSYKSTIYISGTDHPKKMFIAPDKRLYITTNMRNHIPKIYVLDAETYQVLSIAQLTGLPTPQAGVFINYDADFCYNKLNNKVYFIVGVNHAGNNPYFSESNACTIDGDTLPGILGVISGESITTLDTLYNIKEIICTYNKTSFGNTSKLFVNGRSLYIHNCSDDSYVEMNANYTDITYNPVDNTVYGFVDVNPTMNHGRNVKIYSIDYNGAQTYLVNQYGQASALFYNQYDNKLYLYMKLDESKLGRTPVQLIQIDPGSNPPQILNTVSLIDTGFYVEYDHYAWYNFYFNNLTTPYIDPYSNKMYLPNGGHSNVSVVDFEPDEALLLKPYDGDKQESFTWLSFPRLRSASPTVQSVLGGDNIDPNNYTRESQLLNLPLNSQSHNDYVTNVYDGTNWNSTNGLDNCQSTLGYKLTLKYNADPQQTIKLYLHGTVLDPSVTIPHLYGNNKENWVGYWRYQTQDIFDALGSNNLNNITLIEHQDWTCVYTEWIPFGPGQDTATIGPRWYCDSKNHNIKYGDMVILSGPQDIFNFQWNSYGNPPQVQQELSAQHYSYEEKAAYTPIAVMLDSADQPLEIGVFENDTCIGANVVNNGDSVVVLRSYSTGNSSDSLTFEKYYGNKSTQKRKVSEYWVKNKKNGLFEKRKISSGEKSNFFVVSFRKRKTVSATASNPQWYLYPNPATEQVVIEVASKNKTHIKLEVFNMDGKRVALPFSKTVNRGTSQILWNLTGSNGRKLTTGLYLLKLSTENSVAVKKLFIH